MELVTSQSLQIGSTRFKLQHWAAYTAISYFPPFCSAILFTMKNWTKIVSFLEVQGIHIHLSIIHIAYLLQKEIIKKPKKLGLLLAVAFVEYKRNYACYLALSNASSAVNFTAIFFLLWKFCYPLFVCVLQQQQQESAHHLLDGQPSSIQVHCTLKLSQKKIANHYCP